MKSVIVLIAIFLMTACSQNKKASIETKQDSVARQENHNRVIALNNEAMELIKQESFIRKPKKIMLIKAITLLDSAITFDSTYCLAYANKATILCSLNRRTDAILTMKRILQISPQYAEGIDFLGMLYESIGKVKKANREYAKALAVYRERYFRTKKLSDAKELIFSHLLLDEKNIADSLLNVLDFEFPADSIAIKDFKESILTFKRDEYIRIILR